MPTVMHRRDAPIPWWLPNAIAILRIGFIPLFVWVGSLTQQAALAGDDLTTWRLMGVVILFSIGGSDVLDGWLARKYDLSTQFGAVLDAVADKMAQVGLLAYFTWTSGPAFADVPTWFFGIIVGRDVVMALGYAIVRARRGKVHVEHKVHGKASTSLVFVVLLWLTSGYRSEIVLPGLVVIGAFVVASTLAYAMEGVRQFRNAR